MAVCKASRLTWGGLGVWAARTRFLTKSNEAAEMRFNECAGNCPIFESSPSKDLMEEVGSVRGRSWSVMVAVRWRMARLHNLAVQIKKYF